LNVACRLPTAPQELQPIFYKKMKPGEAKVWPPKYWKFHLETDGPSPVKMAYTDPRRFGRVRLVECPGEDIRKFSPLMENGPDPDVDRDIFTQDFFTTKVKNRRVPIKALLLDQVFISGIGNVSDDMSSRTPHCSFCVATSPWFIPCC